MDTMLIKNNLFTWESEVRAYELDLQGILNNANYLHYFDHVRIKHLLSIGLNWQEMHDQGFDLVLYEVTMTLKHPLRIFDNFYITSEITKLSRLKVNHNQVIYRKHDHKLIATSQCTTVCVDIKTGKPTMPAFLDKALFGNQQ
jgi:acyl-CoA thioester hydrolase